MAVNEKNNSGGNDGGKIVPNSKDLQNSEQLSKIIDEWGSSAAKYVRILRETHDVQDSIKKDSSEYLEYLKKWKKTQTEINFLEERLLKLNKENKEENNERISQLIKQINYLKEQNNEIKEGLDSINKWNLGLQMSGKILAKIPDLMMSGFGMIKNSGVFEIDKAIKKSALSLGVFNDKANDFRGNFFDAVDQTSQIGGNIEQMSKMQNEFSDELGRSVELGSKGLVAMTQMAQGTGLGEEAVIKLAASFDKLGMSVEDARDFTQDTYQEARKLGLKPKKILNDITNNMDMLNKYDFKNGAKGLAKMAETANKLGIEMKTIEPMADKAFDIEGAVEMSAQLQVLGGSLSSLADPFKLMYKARNDVEGLTQDFADAAKSSMHFGKNGIEMNTYEMSRLREAAKATGVEYDKIVTMGRNQLKLDEIKKRISLSGEPDKDLEEFLANKAQISKNGVITLNINGDTKDIKNLNKQQLINEMNRQKTLSELAENSKSFDESIDGIINKFKVDFAKGFLTDENMKRISNGFKKLTDTLSDKGFQEAIIGFGKAVGKVFSFVVENWKLIAGVFLGGNMVKALSDVGQWIENGVLLSEGFLFGMKKNNLISLTGGGGGGGGGPTVGGGLGVSAANAATTAEQEGMIFAEGQAARNVTNISNDIGETGTNTINKVGGVTTQSVQNVEKASTSVISKIGNVAKGTLGAIGGTVTGGLLGSGAYEMTSGKQANKGGTFGAIAGGALGTIGALLLAQPELIPLFSTLGSSAGSYIGNKIGEVNDGVVFNPNDKFMKVNDGTMIAGTNVNGNKDLARVLGSQQVNAPSTPINSLPGNLNVQLGDLKINGSIELKLGNNITQELGTQLINDPSFIRNISRLVNQATQTSVSGKPGLVKS